MHRIPFFLRELDKKNTIQNLNFLNTLRKVSSPDRSYFYQPYLYQNLQKQLQCTDPTL